MSDRPTLFSPTYLKFLQLGTHHVYRDSSSFESALGILTDAELDVLQTQSEAVQWWDKNSTQFDMDLVKSKCPTYPAATVVVADVLAKYVSLHGTTGDITIDLAVALKGFFSYNDVSKTCLQRFYEDYKVQHVPEAMLNKDEITELYSARLQYRYAWAVPSLYYFDEKVIDEFLTQISNCMSQVKVLIPVADIVFIEDMVQ